MRSSFVTILAAPLLCALLQPAESLAQTIPSSFDYIERKQEVGFYAGYLDAATGRFGFGPKGGRLVGPRYGLELAGPLSFEGVVGVISGTRDVIDPGRDEGDRKIGEADVLLPTIDARLRFSFAGERMWHKLSPFFTAGAGLVLDQSKASALDETLLPEDVFDLGTSFYGTVGLGTRLFLSESIALRGDGVFSLWKIGTPPGFSDPQRGFVGVEETEWARGLALTMTLLYRW
jgi:hypothetical protein